jgi:hypothetical protein
MTIWKRMLSAAAALTFATFAALAFAGDFYERDGVAIRGYDPVAYFTDKKPVKGLPAHTAQFRGSTFRYAFSKDPARYAPQYDGFCAFGVAGGYKAAIDPAAFTVVDGKLYLNYNAGVQKQWRADIPGFIAKADRNWPQVMKLTKVIE